MSNFEDFDLDLKKVSLGGADNVSKASPLTNVVCATIKLTLNNKCQSVGSATTGMTVGCCAKGSMEIKEDISPQCV